MNKIKRNLSLERTDADIITEGKAY